MADQHGLGVRKHKWLSPPEMSPSKYLKSEDSKLPRRIGQSGDHGDESSSPPRSRHVTLYSYESTPKQTSAPCTDDRRSGRPRIRRRDSTRSRSLDFSKSRQAMTSAEVAPRKSVARGEGDECLTGSGDSAKHKETPKSLRRENSGQHVLFRRAVSEIIGPPSGGRRSRNSVTSSPQEEHEKGERRPGSGEQKQIFPDKEPAGERSPERKHEDVETSTISRRKFRESPPEREAAEQDAQRLVFLYDDDKESDTADSLEKDPSIGSDFSDVEDIESLARFSQEDVVTPCCSFEDQCGPSSLGYVMYPRHLYGSPWSNYTDLWPRSPVYRPSAELDTWRQDIQNVSYLSERSTDVIDNSNLSVSSESECAIEKGEDQSEIYSLPLFSNHIAEPTRRNSQVTPHTEPPKFLGDCFIDTHCHLDMLFSRLSHRGSFAELRKQYSTTFPRQFQGCITDYCDPRTLDRLPWQEILNEDLVWGAFGCHPHFAQYYNKKLLEDIMKALRHPKAIAFGEMGLDYSHKCSTKIPNQHKVFEEQLKVAVALGKPLVIHCRDADEDLFNIMKKWVPWDYKIHRHCFTGSYQDIEPFLNQFPNMAVGFTAVLTYNSAEKTREAVTQIPLERLIVETDAPFFVPRMVPKSLCKFSHPGLALHTIQEIAWLRDLPVKTAMSALRENTRRIYSI